MKQILLTLSIFILLSSCSSKYATVINSEKDYQIIPKPTSLQMKTGKFLLDGNTKVIAVSELENEAEYLSNLLSNITKKNIVFQNDGSKKGNISLQIDPSITNQEGYNLVVNYNEIIISGKTATGIFYGIQTLSQLIPIGKTSSELTIPATQIKDSPRYVYRGMHLDVARHFFSTEFVKKYIDILAMHKMNTFHWHLTEDQGWRIEIKKYPKLTSIGAFRKETIVGHGNTWNKNEAQYDGKPYGGFYTQEEIKEIVAYATERHITVIPEIELPGHSLAAITAYPELGNTGEQYEVGTRWGVFPEIYAPSEQTFKFLEDVLTEVVALFPSKLIHIGGDEAPKVQWENSKFAQEVIKREGLKDEHELQSYFIKRIETFLNSKGRQIIGWDEILEGGLAPNATVMSWRGEKGGIEAAKLNHNVVMTPTQFCYFDFYQTKNRENEPLAIGGKTTVEDVYSYEPTPKELTVDEAKYILGAQANVWTEYITTPEHVEYMILPRLTALSEVVWSKKEDRDWNDFKTRLQHITALYDAHNLNYAKHSLDITIEE
ncbi:beta-N-acetylhexosaminidase [Mariniflexile sp. AS56]|uniref:beta-N-acetylhexosaminidase n=1 Tax=Mariniflexile sp. AS56 TaxID=3063957 RepID=UPI0026EA7608|nr:beta-N-acetylhexosaminidase [Mariniflexile sp. AS56]MDO7172655.1 beta-N-acetylhexosaminidase [Mariniflexile sp. AS56]